MSLSRWPVWIASVVKSFSADKSELNRKDIHPSTAESPFMRIVAYLAPIHKEMRFRFQAVARVSINFDLITIFMNCHIT